MVRTQELDTSMEFDRLGERSRPDHQYIRLNFQPSLDSENDFRSGCWNVSHYQQSFPGLLSPERSNSIEV